MTTREIEYIGQYLRERLEVINNYRNNIYTFPGITEDQRQLIEREEHIYKQQIALKEVLSQELNGRFDRDEINTWIVRRWGGIPKFGTGRNTISYYVTDFSNNLIQNRYNDLKNIPSLSKIASFVNPEEYFIYDSRVAVSLNAILLSLHIIHNTQEWNDVLFYPMPQSNGSNHRTEIMKDLIQERTNGMGHFLEGRVYYSYCKLIKDLYASVFPDNQCQHHPYEIEMLLFVLAERDTDWSIERETVFGNYFRDRRLFYAELDKEKKSKNSQNTRSSTKKSNKVPLPSPSETRLHDSSIITKKPSYLGSRGFKFGKCISISGNEYMCYVGSGKVAEGKVVKCCQIFGITEKASLLPNDIKEGFTHKVGRGIYKIVENYNEGAQVLEAFMDKLRRKNLI